MRLPTLIMLACILLPGTNALEFLFTGPGTVQKNLTINHQQIQGIDLIFEGSPYSGDSPANITFDIGGDGHPEWEYKAYHSAVPQDAQGITAAYSYTPEATEIYFINATPHRLWADTTILCKLENNAFTKYDEVDLGYLGFQSANDITSQVVSLTLENTTVHAFLPETSSITPVGLYIAEGGSTYYCHSDHEDSWDNYCNMTPSQAMVPEHLARMVNMTRFDMSEPSDNNPKLRDAINALLEGCDLPCNITITVSSETAGNLTLSDIGIIPPGEAPNITFTDIGSAYLVNISSSLNLTRVSYVYAAMPEVHVIPFQKEDEIRDLSAAQRALLLRLNSTLAQAWDNLTNSSHPLNFSFYLTPVPLEGFNGSANYSVFVDRRLHDLIPSLNLSEPAIVVTLDIWDYFGHDANTVKISGGDHLARIYVNGFLNDSKRDLYRWDEELLRNLILHELMHAFVDYPPPDEEKRFHSGHPASFTDNPDFTTYSALESPTGKEGYYSIHSIMNQLRIFIAEEDIGFPISLSPLDRMLLGILSPYAGGNHTFYSGNVTDEGYRYNATAMTLGVTYEAYDFYVRSNDEGWWDVRNVTRTWLGTNETFNVTKEPGRALWVFADTAAHIGHFSVNNLGAGSITTNATPLIGLPSDDPPEFDDIRPENLSYHDGTVLINCSAHDATQLKNISIFGNWSGWHRNHTLTLDSQENSSAIEITLPDGPYLFSCEACDNTTCVTSGNRTFTVDQTAPGITPVSPANASTWTSSQTVTFRFNVTDPHLSNCSLWTYERWAANLSSPASGENTMTRSLPNGAYNWSVTCLDLAGNTNSTRSRNLAVSYTAPSPPASGGGGGGGGGGSAPSALADNQRRKTYYSLLAGSEIDWDIPTFDIINLTGTVEKAGLNPEILIIQDECDEIACFTFNVTRLVLEDVSIRFRVNRSLIKEGIAITDGEIGIGFLEIGTDIAYAYFEAEITVPTELFVTAKEQQKPAPAIIQAEPEIETLPEVAVETPPINGTQEEEKAEEEDTGSLWVLIVIPAALLAGAAAYFMMKRE